MAPSDQLPASTTQLPEFPEPDYQQWQRQVEQVLRKSRLLAEDASAPDPVEDVLATTTYDGVRLHPLYTENPGDTGYPGLVPFVRGSKAQGCVTDGWDIRQLHAHPDAAETNREILADLNGGATSLWLRLGPSGLAIDDLGDALADVYLDLVGITLDGGDDRAAADALWTVADDQGISPSALQGNLGADPLGFRARTGQSLELGDAVELASRCARSYPQLRAITVDGLPYHDTGGSDAEELGCCLATAVTYLRELSGVLDIETACRLLEFRYAATADQFATIAKLRAARRLWERVTRECGVAEHLRWQQQHAVTSSAMMTRRDPWVNMLRVTIAAFAAGLGGAQAVTVQPFDAAIGLPNDFARRIARNTPSLLLEESHLARVIDAPGGSWYVETLTEELAGAAWQWFQRIESEGGLPSALGSGLIADQLAATREKRQDATARRTDPVIGVSEYPNLDEQPVHRDPAPAQPSGGLPRIRYAEGFESLRDGSDQVLATTGERPKVFLATLGPIAAHTARTAFARNLLASGGLDTPEADTPEGATETTQAVVDAFTASGASIACLCSNDKVYAERASETALALKQAGATHVLLAGKPDPHYEGVDDHIFAGVNALEILRDLHRRLGVPQ